MYHFAGVDALNAYISSFLISQVCEFRNHNRKVKKTQTESFIVVVVVVFVAETRQQNTTKKRIPFGSLSAQVDNDSGDFASKKLPPDGDSTYLSIMEVEEAKTMGFKKCAFSCPRSLILRNARQKPTSYSFD